MSTASGKCILVLHTHACMIQDLTYCTQRKLNLPITTMVYETMFNERWHTKLCTANDDIRNHLQRTMVYETTCSERRCTKPPAKNEGVRSDLGVSGLKRNGCGALVALE